MQFEYTSAFPTVIDNAPICGGDRGITKRDYFASAIIQGMNANPELMQVITASSVIDGSVFEKMAFKAYQQADAMLKVRGRVGMEDKDEVSWQHTLKVVAAGVFTCLFSKWRYTGLWEALKGISYEVLSFVVQVICLVLFPISIPLLFLIVRILQKDSRESQRKMVEKWEATGE